MNSTNRNARSLPAANVGTETQTLRDMLSMFFYKKNVFWASFLGILAITLAFALFSPPRYVVTAELLVKPALTRPFMVQADPNAYFEATVTLKDLNTVMFLLQSSEHLAQVVVKQGLAPADDPAALQKEVTRLKSRLKVEPLTDSNILRVSLSGPDPEKTTVFLDTLVNHFVDFYIDINRVRKGLDFFESQRQLLQHRLSQLNQELDRLIRL